MPFDLELSVDVLRRTPGTLHALLKDLDEVWVRATEGPDTFSPFDVVGHLIEGRKPTGSPALGSSFRAGRAFASSPTIASAT